MFHFYFIRGTVSTFAILKFHKMSFSKIHINPGWLEGLNQPLVHMATGAHTPTWTLSQRQRPHHRGNTRPIGRSAAKTNDSLGVSSAAFQMEAESWCSHGTWKALIPCIWNIQMFISSWFDNSQRLCYFFTSWYRNFERLCQFYQGVGKQSIGQQSATLLFSQRGVNHKSPFNPCFEANLQMWPIIWTLEKLRDINGPSCLDRRRQSGGPKLRILKVSPHLPFFEFRMF